MSESRDWVSFFRLGASLYRHGTSPPTLPTPLQGEGEGVGGAWDARHTPEESRRPSRDRGRFEVGGLHVVQHGDSVYWTRSSTSAAARRERAFRLWLSCHTQQEIADALNIARRTIADMTEEFGEIGQMAESAAR